MIVDEIDPKYQVNGRFNGGISLDVDALQGSLEDQLHRLKEYEQGVFAYKPHIEELEKIHQAVQEGMIFENRYPNLKHDSEVFSIANFFFAFKETLTLVVPKDGRSGERARKTPLAQ